MSISDKLIAIAENEQQVFEAGKRAEHDRFWDAYLTRYADVNGKIVGMYTFAGSQWHDAVYTPNRPILVRSNSSMMFYATGITDTKVDIDISAVSGNTSQMFGSTPQLKTIRKLIVGETTYLTTAFTDAKALTNITIDGTIGRNCNMQWCPLTGDSIRSVISALSPTETGRTVTFNKAAKEAAFTQAEWETLIAAKSNWTFALV